MKYSPGTSGNYNGRPVGSKNKRTQLTVLLESRAEDLLNKLLEVALAGDVNALRFCVERLIPKAHHEPLDIDLTMNINDQRIRKIKNKILNSALSGLISFSDADKIIKLLDDQNKKAEVSIPLKINTTDPIEASRIYQRIMMQP
jgi:hypothetical protein